jgi:hypothetical protein
VYDMLTLEELARLHDSLHRSHGKLHDRLTGPAREIEFGPDWDIAHRAACDMTETMMAIGAEINLRLADPDPCRTCGFTHAEADCPRWPANA